MEYFQKIDVPWLPDAILTMLREATQDESLWLTNTKQQKYNLSRFINPKQQEYDSLKNTQSILIRTFDMASGDEGVHPDYIMGSCYTPEASLFPVTVRAIHRIANEQNGLLGRVAYIRFKPYSETYPRLDGTANTYYGKSERYHIVIHSKFGSPFVSGDDKVIMKNGECWWFENLTLYYTSNHSDAWCIHLVFDLIPLGRLPRHIQINHIPKFI